MILTPSSDRMAAKGEPLSIEDEFEAAFVQHYPRILAVLQRMLRDVDEADELAMETFWRLWQSGQAQIANPEAWLVRVALNLGYNRLRAAKRRLAYELKSGKLDLEQNAPQGPEEAVEREQLHEKVRGCLAQIPQRDAQILVLRASGFTYAEIAAALKANPASIGKWINRAEKRFERWFSQGDSDETYTR